MIFHLVIKRYFFRVQSEQPLPKLLIRLPGRSFDENAMEYEKPKKKKRKRKKRDSDYEWVGPDSKEKKKKCKHKHHHKKKKRHTSGYVTVPLLAYSAGLFTRVFC